MRPTVIEYRLLRAVCGKHPVKRKLVGGIISGADDNAVIGDSGGAEPAMKEDVEHDAQHEQQALRQHAKMRGHSEVANSLCSFVPFNFIQRPEPA